MLINIIQLMQKPSCLTKHCNKARSIIQTLNGHTHDTRSSQSFPTIVTVVLINFELIITFSGPFLYSCGRNDL